MDNPVYYVQYGHARIASILAKAARDGVTLLPDRARPTSRCSRPTPRPTCCGAWPRCPGRSRTRPSCGRRIVSPTPRRISRRGSIASTRSAGSSPTTTELTQARLWLACRHEAGAREPARPARGERARVDGARRRRCMRRCPAAPGPCTPCSTSAGCVVAGVAADRSRRAVRHAAARRRRRRAAGPMPAGARGVPARVLRGQGVHRARGAADRARRGARPARGHRRRGRGVPAGGRARRRGSSSTATRRPTTSSSSPRSRPASGSWSPTASTSCVGSTASPARPAACSRCCCASCPRSRSRPTRRSRPGTTRRSSARRSRRRPRSLRAGREPVRAARRRPARARRLAGPRRGAVPAHARRPARSRGDGCTTRPASRWARSTSAAASACATWTSASPSLEALAEALAFPRRRRPPHGAACAVPTLVVEPGRWLDRERRGHAVPGRRRPRPSPPWRRRSPPARRRRRHERQRATGAVRRRVHRGVASPSTPGCDGPATTGPSDRMFTVVGRHCESGDTLAEGVRLAARHRARATCWRSRRPAPTRTRWPAPTTGSGAPRWSPSATAPPTPWLRREDAADLDRLEIAAARVVSPPPSRSTGSSFARDGPATRARTWRSGRRSWPRAGTCAPSGSPARCGRTGAGSAVPWTDREAQIVAVDDDGRVVGHLYVAARGPSGHAPRRHARHRGGGRRSRSRHRHGADDRGGAMGAARSASTRSCCRSIRTTPTRSPSTGSSGSSRREGSHGTPASPTVTRTRY